MTVVLDLVELDGKATAEAIVDEILRQNPTMLLPVPVEDLARLAGVERIQPLESAGFEGMLVTNENKTRGEIFYNQAAIPPRVRFTIGHELGHFLFPHHKQTKFECSQDDMTRYDRNSNQRLQQEAEANSFSSELLMPRPIFQKRMRELGEPKFEDIHILRKECETSVEATTRRYVALSDYPCAAVFAKERTVRYFVRNEEFPYWLDVKPGLSLPKQSHSYESRSGLDEWREMESWIWLQEMKGRALPDRVLEQVLWQDSGYKIVLLQIENLPGEEDE